jgi:hypothetical protein
MDSNQTNIFYTNVPHRVSQTRLAVLPNCNADDKCTQWLGALNGETTRGCGINVLRFMNEIDEPQAENGLRQAMNGGQGTPFEHVVTWFNVKFQNSDTIRKQSIKDGFTYSVLEGMSDINSIYLLQNFFDMITNELPLNSCIIVKLNRDPDPTKRPGNLTPGHYVLITKHPDGSIWTYEPFLSTPGNCIRRQFIKPVSENFFNAYRKQGYLTASYLLVKATLIAAPIPAPPAPIPAPPAPILAPPAPIPAEVAVAAPMQEPIPDFYYHRLPPEQPGFGFRFYKNYRKPPGRYQVNRNRALRANSRPYPDPRQNPIGGGMINESNNKSFFIPDNIFSEFIESIEDSIECNTDKLGGKKYKSKRNKSRKHKSKRNKSKRNKSKRNKSKRNKSKKSSLKK